ncbi:GntR family transcriptional regulator [Streptomyces sp. NBC_00433]
MADSQSNAALPAPPLPEGAPPAGVIHVRHRHADRFTVVGNHLAQHPHLSAVAIGLAVYIQSLPDGAPVSVKALAAHFPEGEVTVRRAMNELQAAGYLERRRVPLGGGRFATRAFAYDRPRNAGPTSGPGRRDGRGSRPAPGPGSGPAARGLRGGLAHGGRGLVGPSRAPRTHRAAPVTVRAAAPAQSGPAADVLSRLRLADPRLLLSARDIAHLAPSVDDWLARAVAPAQITRALTTGLPPLPEPIHHPARFLEHRLTALLPPPLPPETARPAPLRTCDGCDRAIRTHDPAARCIDCRPPEPA